MERFAGSERQSRFLESPNAAQRLPHDAAESALGPMAGAIETATRTEPHGLASATARRRSGAARRRLAGAAC
ncbi:hypothetical protein, partial [Rhodobium orientis]|uniref:hypothetical protein n=1 Tax=Rhodobium orientis TaxID=34017 RepID=UPI001AECF415